MSLDVKLLGRGIEVGHFLYQTTFELNPSSQKDFRHQLQAVIYDTTLQKLFIHFQQVARQGVAGFQEEPATQAPPHHAIGLGINHPQREVNLTLRLHA